MLRSAAAGRTTTMDQTSLILVNVLIGICAGLCGIVGTLLLKKDARAEQHGDRLDQRTHSQDIDLARLDERSQLRDIDLAELKANINLLLESRDRLEATAHRVSKIEGWQEIMKPRIDEAHEGLRAVARLDERMRTVFTMLERIQHTLNDRSAHPGHAHPQPMAAA